MRDIRKIKLKKSSINKYIILCVFFASIISYEIHVYTKYYTILNMGLLLSGFLLVLFNTKGYRNNLKLHIRSIRDNLLIVFLTVLLMINTMISSLTVGYLTPLGLLGVISIIVSIFIFYLFIPNIAYSNIECINKLLVRIITPCSIIGIIIGIRGSFFSYYLDGSRSASIFFDANYFASLAAIAVLLALKDKTIIGYVIGIINFIAIYYTGSRTAMLGVILMILLSNIYYKKISFRKILLLVIISFVSYYGVEYLYKLGYFRTSQGLTGRESLWRVSVDYILREPIWGYGHGQVKRILHEGGIYSAASSHNYFIDYALMFGIPALLSNIFIIAVGFIRGIKNNIEPYIIQIIFYLLISMNSIVLSLGGVGITSLLFTVFLGISNNSKSIKMKKKEEYYDKNIVYKK